MATEKKTAAANAKPAVKKAAPAANKKTEKADAPAKAAKSAAKEKAAAAPASKKAEKLPVQTAPVAAAKPAPAAEPKADRKKNKVEDAPVVVAAAPAKKAVEKKEPSKPVKMPKITAQGKVPYEPDFTHSVLDGPKDNAPVTTPTQRYSDSDLAEFRELISRKLETARKELSYLQGLITRKDDTGADGEDGRYMTMEDGTLSMEREQLSQMASRQIQFIDHLEKAMIRIENKTYGICRETGKLIDKARLRAVPHATLSVEAKMRKSR
jgi:RNA polymerase-binding transcription factor DksA